MPSALSSERPPRLSRSHPPRPPAIAPARPQERWLAALFGQFCDPASGALSPTDDGALELAAKSFSARAKLAAAGSSSARRRGGGGGGPGKGGGGGAAEAAAEEDAARLVLFTALGRALAMALVSRAFVPAPLSPVLCKLLVGRPVHFLDLLSANQDLFQDLLRLMMMTPESVLGLNLVMPRTGTEGGEKGPRNASRDGVKWPGRGARAGVTVTGGNRLEYVYRKMEHQFLTRTRTEFAAVRRGLFEVIPQELLSVFDHRELVMLLNGHTSAKTRDLNVSL